MKEGIFCRSGLLALLLMGGCTYGMQRTVQVELVPAVEVDAVERFAPTVQLDVGEFVDGREEKLFQASGSEDADTLVVKAEGNVGAVVKSTLEKFLRTRQTGPYLSSAPKLTGTVREWHVDVSRGGLTLNLDARAVVDVDLRDEAGRVLFTAHYIGTATAQEVYARERRLKQLLSQAMGQALHELVQDKALNSRISIASEGGYISPTS